MVELVDMGDPEDWPTAGPMKHLTSGEVVVDTEDPEDRSVENLTSMYWATRHRPHAATDARQQTDLSTRPDKQHKHCDQSPTNERPIHRRS